MNPLVTTSTSALPGRPERPVKYVPSTTAPDGRVAWDRPLENYFDASMAQRLLPSKPPSRLYDTIARAHDHRFQVTPDMVDPSRTSPRPLILRPRERRRSVAKLRGNAPDYMGISPDAPEWRPRRSSYEDRRGAVGVTPSEVNTLVPYIPPIDSLPPPPKEDLDKMARAILDEAQRDSRNSLPNTTIDVTPKSGPPPSSDDNAFFDYDTDSTFDGPAASSRPVVPQPAQQAPQVESEPNPYDNEISWSDVETDTDSDTDMDDGYNKSFSRIAESFPEDARRWLIPRKRPSVVIIDRKDDPAGPPSSEDEQHVGKRRRGRKSAYSRRISKKPKQHAQDTPARHDGKSTGLHHQISDSEEDERASSLPPPARSSSLGNGSMKSRPPVSSITATTLQMKQVQITSPRVPSPQIVPQPHSSSVPPRSPKLFPCGLEGCTQVCASAGDLQRHQQSLRHSRPGHSCLACGKSYTRSDALKRHLNSKASCKKVHATKLVISEQGQAEANQEAV